MSVSVFFNLYITYSFNSRLATPPCWQLDKLHPVVVCSLLSAFTLPATLQLCKSSVCLCCATVLSVSVCLKTWFELKINRSGLPPPLSFHLACDYASVNHLTLSSSTQDCLCASAVQCGMGNSLSFKLSPVLNFHLFASHQNYSGH